MSWTLFDVRGRRKYLVAAERKAFIEAAIAVGGETSTFCMVLAFSGARISEVLAVTPERVDMMNGSINFETLKRRRRGVFRAVPVPKKLLDILDDTHRIRDAQSDSTRADKPLWRWSRTTAWRRVKHVMSIAGQPEHISQPKALRHAFGAQAAKNKVSLTLIKKWMGHAKIETTEIYTELVGDEERSLARLTWENTCDGF